MATKNITVLGIDTSCDDTCVAVLKIENLKLKILSNIVSSQGRLHQKYGGVYPFLAKREHQKNLPLVFKKATKGYKLSDIDLIGVTVGPGLEPCLWQGINFAKDLAKRHKKHLIPVNHIEAHILANWLEYRNIPLPAMCLVVSGGHTQLILMREIGKYKLIGETRDDAAGECFDKVARILGLGYPGGPAIAQQAARKFEIRNSKFEINLPKPMIKQKNYDFSFSGLKTAVLYKVRSGKYNRRAMAAEVQQAIIDVLIYKTLKAAKDYKVKSIILGGGVAANNELRRQFKERIKKEIPDSKFYIPDSKFCTDNAAMIAITAYFHHAERKKDIKANANLRI
jgi:N6-L-threonylcarbamoyladenine synthase